jgi:Tat protein translocase TatB subunit
MFDIGLQEILLIGVLALLVFGPTKLPDLGRMVGRAMREFRRASDEFRSTVETNLHINDPDGSTSPTYPEPSAVADPAPVETPAPSAPVALGVEPESGAESSAEPFCAQRGSPLVHRRECAWVRRIPVAERVHFKHLADAREQGLRTCPVCEPWEPA